MNDEFDIGAAASALIKWFQSQDISTDESVDLMVRLIAFRLAVDSNNVDELGRYLGAAQAGLTINTMEWWEREDLPGKRRQRKSK